MGINVSGHQVGIGRLLVALALLVTVILLVVGRLELLWLGVILLLIEIGVLV